VSDTTQEKKGGWFQRLKSGLSRSSGKLGDGITGIFTKRRLDDQALEELEDLLITADLGVATAARLTANLAKTRFDKQVDPQEVREALAADIAKILEPVAQPLLLDPAKKPNVVLVVGVNGSGKTTTIGKLAAHYRREGLAVRLAAGDTFRAAAIEQLKIWGERAGCPVVAGNQGADAAGLAFSAVEAARAAGDDLLLIDTAGRLHNKAELMAELQKVARVIKKVEPTAPHHVVLVLDATTGQNALSQVGTFKELVDITGLVVTKLDGSARGGVLVALAEKFGLPVHVVGVGEGADDFRPFTARDFARALVGLEQAK
jgi:fused signal recognition particle receptor